MMSGVLNKRKKNTLINNINNNNNNNYLIIVKQLKVFDLVCLSNTKNKFYKNGKSRFSFKLASQQCQLD